MMHSVQPKPSNGLKIVAVDDNVAHNYALERSLRYMGYDISMASSGEQLLGLVTSEVDAVILDVNLPDIDGFELCRRIRAKDETAHLPIVFLSATSLNSPSHDLATRLGADAFLAFPVDPEQLDAVIQGTIAKRKKR